MLRWIPVAVVLLMVAGCGPTPEQQYDAALQDFESAQSRLDGLRPAFDAAREKAQRSVYQEIAGKTLEESASDALSQLQGLTDGTLTGQPAGDGTAADADNRPMGDPDAALDQLLAAHEQMQEVQAAATASITQSSDLTKKINTPGTPENKRFEEVFEAMPEVKAYRRQENRVERAQQALEAAEAALPEPAGSDAS